MSQKLSAVSEFRRLISLSRAPLWTYVAIPLATILGAALTVFPPRFTGQIIDALGKHQGRAAVSGLVLYVGVTVLATIISLLGSLASRFQRETMARNLRVSLFARLHTARIDALSKMGLGELSNRVLADVQTMSGVLENSVMPGAASFCMLVATIGAMAQENLGLAMVAFSFSFLALVPQFLSKARLISLQRRRAIANDELYDLVGSTATLSALITLRTQAASQRVMRRVASATNEIRSINLEQAVVGSATAFASSLLSVIGPTAVLAIGAYLAVSGRMSVGTIVTLLIYQSRMLAPFGTISQLQVSIAGLGIITHRLLEVADLPQELGGTQKFNAGDIAWNGVHAAHDSRQVLQGVQLSIKPGEHVAIVGVSGAGKSTLAASLLRLIDPHQGIITVQGIDVRDFSLESLREATCIVEQHAQVFDGTLLSNITLKSANATAEDVDRAIKLSRLDTFIAAQPEGLDTRVGARGIRLSGGEQQRICLARALLQNPDILIVDEAFTGLDGEVEKAIIDDLRSFFKDRILIVITHRLSAVTQFSRIIIMESGVIVAQGTHEELQESNSWYNVVSGIGAVPGWNEQHA
jgi:ATP-binding cassette subfamily B protein